MNYKTMTIFFAVFSLAFQFTSCQMLRKNPGKNSSTNAVTGGSLEIPRKINVSSIEYTFDDKYEKWFHNYVLDWIKPVQGLTIEDLKTLIAGRALLGDHFLMKSFADTIVRWDDNGLQRSGKNPVILEKIELKNKNGITIVSSTPRILPVGAEFWTKATPYDSYRGASFEDLIYQSDIGIESCEKSHLLGPDKKLAKELYEDQSFYLVDFINKSNSPFPYTFGSSRPLKWEFVRENQVVRAQIQLKSNKTIEQGSIVRSIIKEAPPPKGGDKIKFYAVMGCEGNFSYSTTPKRQVRVVPFFTTVRTVSDGTMTIKSELGDVTYKTKELKGFISGLMLNNEQSAKCLIGTTVFDDKDRIVGIISDYNYSDLPSVDNLSIASIYDERVAQLVNHYYKKSENYNIYRDHVFFPKLDGLALKWQATAISNQFDPTFLADLERNFNTYVIENTWARHQCDRTIDLGQECDRQTQKFKDILKFKTTSRANLPPQACIRAPANWNQRRMVCPVRRSFGF